MSRKRSRRSIERTSTVIDPILELEQEQLLMELSSGVKSRSRSVKQLKLPPGFRFTPTDEELVLFYLKKKAESQEFEIPVIASVDLYKFDPWKLPEEALFGEKEWYFFSPRDRKYPKGDRPNRAAASGYWKATGTDKPIAIGKHRTKVGVRKSLVFYTGKAPNVEKTNWIMHEYRLDESVAPSATRHHRDTLRLDDWVLCKIREKQSNHAERQEHDMECMLANPTEFDDQLRSDSATQEEAVADTSTSMETMIPFSTSMNPAAITLTMINGWNNNHHLHESMASTSYAHEMLGLQSTPRLPPDYMMQYHPSLPSFYARAAAAGQHDSFFPGDDADGTPLPPLNFDYELGSFSFDPAYSVHSLQ